MTAVRARDAIPAAAEPPVRVVDVASVAAVRGFSLALLHELDPLLDSLEREAKDGTVAGVVLCIGGAFEGGADLDLEELRSLPDVQARRVWSSEGQRVLRRVETLPVPTVALMEGGCFSGGLQLALACGSRICADSDAFRVGFPEARLGLLPGWGGVVRLPRLVGLAAGLDLLLSAATLDAAAAAAIGLIDHACGAEDAETQAVERVLRAARSGRSGRRRRSVARRLLEQTAPGRSLTYVRSRRRKRDHSAIPAIAAETVVRAASNALGAPLEPSFAIEAEAFAETTSALPVRGILHASLLLGPSGRIAAPAGATGAATSSNGRHAAVLGGGVRGAFYSDLLVSAGFSVKLKDTSGEAGRRSLELVRARLSWAEGRREFGGREIESRMQRLKAATGYGGFGRLDAVFEATMEDVRSKIDVLGDAETHVLEGCLLVTTSAIVSVEEIGAALQRPERLVGMHLLPIAADLAPAEIVRGPATSEDAVRRACELARRLGRVPVEVADSPGLVLPRLATLYVAAAEELQAEGVTPARVDRAMRAVGLPVGPFEFGELLGRGSLEKAASLLASRLDGRFRLRASSPFVTPNGSGPGHARWLGPLDRLFRNHSQDDRGAGENAATRRWTDSRIQLRILMILANEGARIVEEGVVHSPRDLDLLVNLGLGFPADRGGLLFWADSVSPRRLQELLTRERPSSDLLKPAPLLLDLADSNGRFYEVPTLRPAPTGQQVAHAVQ